MTERDQERPRPQPGWKPLPRGRPWYRKLSSQQLAETEVHTPTGATYIVRVVRNAPIAGLADAAGTGDPIISGAGLIKANLLAAGDTGWTVAVLKPSTAWRSERSLYRQHVGARAILIDVTLAITDALERGDTLWDDDEDY